MKILKAKKVLVFRYGKFNGWNMSLDEFKKMKLHKQCIIVLNFDDNNIIGFANNFTKNKGVLTCDITINDNNVLPIDILRQLCVVPKLIGSTKRTSIFDSSLSNLSVCVHPADLHMKENLKDLR